MVTSGALAMRWISALAGADTPAMLASLGSSQVLTDTLPTTLVEWSDVQGMATDWFSQGIVSAAIAVMVALALFGPLLFAIRSAFGVGRS